MELIFVHHEDCVLQNSQGVNLDPYILIDVIQKMAESFSIKTIVKDNNTPNGIIIFSPGDVKDTDVLEVLEERLYCSLCGASYLVSSFNAQLGDDYFFTLTGEEEQVSILHAFKDPENNVDTVQVVI